MEQNVLKLSYAGLYPKNGVAVYRYAVTGPKDQVAAYVATQEKIVLQENTTNPLYFSHKPLGCECELRLSRDGKQFFPKDDEALMVQSMAKSMGAAGDAILVDFAKDRIKAMMLYLAKQKTATKPTTEQPVVDEEPADGL